MNYDNRLITGIWRGMSPKPKASDFTLQFYEDGQCEIYGTLFFDKRKPFITDNGEYFITDVIIEINGDGKYFLESDGKITINAVTAVRQKTYFDNNGFVIEDYGREINYGGKFEKIARKDADILYLQNKDGIIGFNYFTKTVKP